MKIGYVTHYNAHELINWSGLGYYIWRALSSAGASIEFIGDLSDKQSFLVKAFRKFEYAFHKNSRWFMVHQSERVAHNYAGQVTEKLKGLQTDCILSPSSFPIAYLETDQPKIFYTDATFHRMLNYYNTFMRLTTKCIDRGHKIEKQAIDSCTLAIYSSEWAAESAIKFYGADPAKIKVVPFGPNITSETDFATVSELIERKPYEPLNLLFVGVDWDRKGGNIVIETCLELEKRGIPVVLNIVGVDTVPYTNLPSNIKVHGFLQKTFSVHKQILEKLYKDAHFTFVPSAADCSPLVFAEGAAYGVPAITRATGGIPSIIQNDYNGKLLPYNASIGEFADAVESLFYDKQAYKKMCFNAYEEYNGRLNWKTNGRRVLELLTQVVPEESTISAAKSVLNE